MDLTMKKLLLTTAAVLAAGVANAQSPTITVGGNADFQVGVTGQDQAYETDVFSRDYHTRNDTELFFNIDGKTDGGLKYGAYIELEADAGGPDNNLNGGDPRAGAAERTFIYLAKDGWGKVEFGATGDAGDRLRVDASRFNSNTLASATGGIGGDFRYFANLGSNQYILPGLPTAAGFNGSAGFNGNAFSTPFNEFFATANKVSYYSPRIAGFQLGASFTPDIREKGTATGFSGENDAAVENVINAGLNYEQAYDIDGTPLTIAASLTGEIGSAEVATRDDLQAYAFGLSAGYMGFTLGGSYGLLDEMNALSATNTEGSYWTAGAAYEFGPFSTSVTYLASEVDSSTIDSEFTNLSVGADYALAPGLMPYVEVSFFEADDNNSLTEDNDGTVVIVGTQLTF